MFSILYLYVHLYQKHLYRGNIQKKVVRCNCICHKNVSCKLVCLIEREMERKFHVKVFGRQVYVYGYNYIYMCSDIYNWRTNAQEKVDFSYLLEELQCVIDSFGKLIHFTWYKWYTSRWCTQEVQHINRFHGKVCVNLISPFVFGCVK